VNDPGARIVAAALAAGIPVTVLPGPSAVETALVASGLAGEQYRFLGYLPRRRPELEELWRELESWPHPAVAFESPQRLPDSLESLAAAHPDRPLAVCRELTKLHEEIVRGTAAEVASRFRSAPKGEITVVLGPGSSAGGTDVAEAVEAVHELVSAGLARKRAVQLVSRLSGAPRNELYRLSTGGGARREGRLPDDR
jgi:16S rRNA (cytidine1402-2'-O)-methyltransferase